MQYDITLTYSILRSHAFGFGDQSDIEFTASKEFEKTRLRHIKCANIMQDCELDIPNTCNPVITPSPNHEFRLVLFTDSGLRRGQTSSAILSGWDTFRLNFTVG